MRMPINIIPEEIIVQYDLLPLGIDGSIYIEIRKGMYGLPHAGKIAYDRLKDHLANYGYSPAPHTPGLWRHSHRHISFTLVVDDFGNKSVGHQHTTHLTNALRDIYTITTDPTGALYCGMNLEWNYDRHYMDISMPGYVANALHKFHHPTPPKSQDSPFKFVRPNYGSTVQYAPEPDNTPLLSPSGKPAFNKS